VPTLQLLSLLTSPEEPALAHTTKLADRLRSAPKTDFPAAFERFMVAFGRICYAEMPDLEALAAWGAGGEPKGRETWRIWEGELERAGGTSAAHAPHPQSSPVLTLRAATPSRARRHRARHL
jgi:hypothetical protein